MVCPACSVFSSISASASILSGNERILNFSVPRGWPLKESAKLPWSFSEAAVDGAAPDCAMEKFVAPAPIIRRPADSPNPTRSRKLADGTLDINRLQINLTSSHPKIFLAEGFVPPLPAEHAPPLKHGIPPIDNKAGAAGVTAENWQDLERAGGYSCPHNDGAIPHGENPARPSHRLDHE